MGCRAVLEVITSVEGLPDHLSIFHNSCLHLVTPTVFFTLGQEALASEAKENMTVREAVHIVIENSPVIDKYKPVPAFCSPHCKAVLTHVCVEFPVFPFLAIAPCPIAAQYCKEPGPLYLPPTLQIFININQITSQSSPG